MKRFGLLGKLALLVCTAIAVAVAAQPTLAYITARSNTLNNSFRVVYLPPQELRVPIAIEKTVVNLGGEEIGPGGFAFSLTNMDTGEAVTATTAGDGRAAMELTFTAGDVGKTYRYRLCEVDTGREHVIYDDTVYEIGISLALNELHELSAQLTLDGKRVTSIVAAYENRYAAPHSLPDTGDHTHLLLWTAMLLFSGAGLIVLKKNRAAYRRPQ